MFSDIVKKITYENSIKKNYFIIRNIKKIRKSQKLLK